MEQLNRIELVGRVGRIRIQTFGDTRQANILMATNVTYKDKNGDVTVETTWHTVIAWEGRNIDCLDQIDKGMDVRVVGRLRYQRYTLPSGHEGLSSEIIASKVELVDGENMQYETIE